MKKLICLMVFLSSTILMANENSFLPDEIKEAKNYFEKIGYRLVIERYVPTVINKNANVITFEDVKKNGLESYFQTKSSSLSCDPVESNDTWFVELEYDDDPKYGYDYEFGQCAWNFDCFYPGMFNPPLDSGSDSSGDSTQRVPLWQQQANGVCDSPYTSFIVYCRVKEYAWIWISLFPSGGFWARAYLNES